MWYIYVILYIITTNIVRISMRFVCPCCCPVHQNYVGADGEKNPFFLSVVLTDANSQGAQQYRAILWRKTVSRENQGRKIIIRSAEEHYSLLFSYFKTIYSIEFVVVVFMLDWEKYFNRRRCIFVAK